MLVHPDLFSAINVEAANQVKEGTFFKIAK